MFAHNSCTITSPKQEICGKLVTKPAEQPRIVRLKPPPTRRTSNQGRSLGGAWHPLMNVKFPLIFLKFDPPPHIQKINILATPLPPTLVCRCRPLERQGRVCEGGPRARLRSWAASRRVCGVGPLAGQAHESQNWPLRLALGKRQKPSFLCSRARGGACGRFWVAAGWLVRALAGR
jgi:hypothetical protein